MALEEKLYLTVVLYLTLDMFARRAVFCCLSSSSLFPLSDFLIQRLQLLLLVVVMVVVVVVVVSVIVTGFPVGLSVINKVNKNTLLLFTSILRALSRCIGAAMFGHG